MNAITWPDLRIAPVNLWSFPAAWKIRPRANDAALAALPAAPQRAATQANQTIQALLRHR